jgi:hypothetical protein
MVWERKISYAIFWYCITVREGCPELLLKPPGHFWLL